MGRGGDCDRADLPPGALRMSEPKLRPLKSTARNRCGTSKKREAQETAAAAAGWHKSQRYTGERREGGASSAPTRERRTGEEGGATHSFVRASLKVAATLIWLAGRRVGRNFVDYYLAGFHYPADVFDGDVDVGEWVAFDGDEVGEIAGGYGAEFGGLAEEFGGVGGRGAQGLLGSHASFDEPAEFACVFPKHGVDGVGAHGEFHASFVGFARSFEIAFDERLGLFLKSIRVTNLLPIVQVVAIVVDGGDVKGAAAGHFLDGGVVHVGGVFEGVGAGADGVARAIGSVGMDGDFFAELVSGVNGGFDLVVGIRLEAGDVIVGAGGSEELDDVGSGGDLLTDNAEDFGDAIGYAARGEIEAGLIGRAGDGESIAADEHAGADHFAVIDKVAHGDVHILIGAEVSDGGDAGFQSAERAFTGEEDFDGGRIFCELREHGLAGSFVGVVGHVGVDVDEAGEGGEFGEIDYLGAGRNVGGIGGDGFDFVVFDEDDGVGPELAMGVPEFAEFDGFEGFGRGKRLRRGDCREDEKGEGNYCSQDFHGVRSVFWFEVPMNGFSAREAGKQRRSSDL